MMSDGIPSPREYICLQTLPHGNTILVRVRMILDQLIGQTFCFHREILVLKSNLLVNLGKIPKFPAKIH